MFLNYLKIAWAVFNRRRFFTFVNLFGITFTLAILMAGVAMLDHVFGPTPPEVNHDRTLLVMRVNLWLENEDGSVSSSTSGLAGLNLLQETLYDLPGAETAAITKSAWRVQSYVGSKKISSFLKYTDQYFWDAIRFEFLEGRPYTMDEVTNADHVCVINDATREKYFGDSPAAGRDIEIDGVKYRVIGVVENVPFVRQVSFSDIYMPLTLDPEYNKTKRLAGMCTGIVVAQNKSKFPMIREEFLHRIEQIDLSEYGNFNHIAAIPETLLEQASRLFFGSGGKGTKFHTEKVIGFFVFVMVMFMILPAMNMVNLNVSRIMERASEIGIRKSFGAPSTTLVGQFIVENLLLTLAGGILGILVAYGILGFISFTGWIPYATFTLNWRIYSLAILMTLFFGLVSGVYPAWKMSRMKPVDALRGGIS